jgi:hypothetical protein
MTSFTRAIHNHNPSYRATFKPYLPESANEFEINCIVVLSDLKSSKENRLVSIIYREKQYKLCQNFTIFYSTYQSTFQSARSYVLELEDEVESRNGDNTTGKVTKIAEHYEVPDLIAFVNKIPPKKVVITLQMEVEHEESSFHKNYITKRAKKEEADLDRSIAEAEKLYVPETKPAEQAVSLILNNENDSATPASNAVVDKIPPPTPSVLEGVLVKNVPINNLVGREFRIKVSEGPNYYTRGNPPYYYYEDDDPHDIFAKSGPYSVDVTVSNVSKEKTDWGYVVFLTLQFKYNYHLIKIWNKTNGMFADSYNFSLEKLKRSRVFEDATVFKEQSGGKKRSRKQKRNRRRYTHTRK